MGKDCDFEKIFDDALSEALNEYIEEESSVWEAEMMSIPEPAYSPKYKKLKLSTGFSTVKILLLILLYLLLLG